MGEEGEMVVEEAMEGREEDEKVWGRKWDPAEDVAEEKQIGVKPSIEVYFFLISSGGESEGPKEASFTLFTP